MFRIFVKLPSLASTRRSNWCACNLAHTHTRGSAALSAVTLYTEYWCWCFRLWSAPERTHTRTYLLIHVRSLHLLCGVYLHIGISYLYEIRIVSRSCDISRDIGNKISHFLSILISTYSEKIAKYVSRILDTIPNTINSLCVCVLSWPKEETGRGPDFFSGYTV